MKNFLFITFLFACFSLFGQEQVLNDEAKKYINRAEMAMELIKKPMDWQKVIEELNAANLYAPNHPIIIYNLAISYDAMGIIDVNNYRKAIKYYNKFLILTSSTEDKEDVKTRINKAEYAIENVGRQQAEESRLRQQEIENQFGKYLGKWRWAGNPGVYRDELAIWFFMDGDALKVKYISEYNTESHLNSEEFRDVPTEYATSEVLIYDDGTLEFTTTQICRGVVVENGAEERFQKEILVHRLKLNQNRLVGSTTSEYFYLLLQTWYRESKKPIRHLTLEKALKAGDASVFPTSGTKGWVHDETFVR